MRIGGSLLLIAVGAILVFALQIRGPGWVNLDLVGWILMAVGIVGLLVSLAFWRRRPAAADDVVVTERRTYP